MAPLPFLDWPADLFARAHAASLSRVTAKPRTSETNCACGCNQKHNTAVSWLEDDDGTRRVIWFRSIACMNKHMGASPGNILS